MGTRTGLSSTEDHALELRARSGNAVLVASDGSELAPDDAGLPFPLVNSLHEWAGVVEREVGDAELVTRRGRQLAKRIAVEIDCAVSYLDPISGTRSRISGAGRSGAAGRTDGARASRTARGGRTRGSTTVSRAGGPGPPTPWATGLTVTAIVGAITVVVLVVVTLGLGEVSPLLAIVVNLAVAAGFAPSIWLGRRMPVWRWVAHGTAAGIVLAWIALLLSLLG